jgi:quercetin dioxygenase-like cupin family protein
MALISLERGESFGHRHDEDSYTLLVSGDADLETPSGVVALVRGQKVVTPANEHHSVVARSAGVVFECRHYRPRPQPPGSS